MNTNLELRGLPVSPGIAIGKLYCYRPHELVVERHSIPGETAENEVQRLTDAILASRESINNTRAQAEKRSGRSIARIFEAQELILTDEYFLDEIRNEIRTQLVTADSAVYESLKQAIDLLAQKSDPIFRERAADLRDVCRRVLHHLSGTDSGHIELTEPCILCAKDLTPSELIHIDPAMLLGVALDEGGETSHSAILARVFGVPAIVGLKRIVDDFSTGTPSIINGNSGKLIIEPDDSRLEKYAGKIAKFEEYRKLLKSLREVKATTSDGQVVHLHANIELPIELHSVDEANADGIGLFRTEYLYLTQETFPSEEEQFNAYREVIERMAPKPVVIRTFDLGGDKVASEQQHREPNPFMGWRAIRVSLDRQEMFRTQLRAIARAAVYGNASIMFPMIVDVSELRLAKSILQEVYQELSSEGIEFNRAIPVGVMIEVPSAAILVDLIVQEVEFISIGTNDLTQFTLAVDRSNPRVARLYQPFHLSVLRLIKQVIDAGTMCNRKVSICGELGGNSLASVLLIGIGLREFSMSPLLIPEIKAIIQTVTLAECEAIAHVAMSLSTADEITEYLRTTLRKRLADLPVWFGR